MNFLRDLFSFSIIAGAAGRPPVVLGRTFVVLPAAVDSNSFGRDCTR